VASASVMIITAFAGLFAWTGATLGVMDRAANALLIFSESPVILLIALNFLLLVAGMLMDAISIFYIFLPILIPVMGKLGWDPMWFGVMMAVNLSIGTLTPPVAVNLFVAANLAKISMERISRAVMPFVFALIGALLIITYIPELSLWLPRVFGFHE
jgi:C4-dicarboxylate transporter DctM subunit